MNGCRAIFICAGHARLRFLRRPRQLLPARPREHGVCDLCNAHAALRGGPQRSEQNRVPVQGRCRARSHPFAPTSTRGRRLCATTLHSLQARLCACCRLLQPNRNGWGGAFRTGQNGVFVFLRSEPGALNCFLQACEKCTPQSLRRRSPLRTQPTGASSHNRACGFHMRRSDRILLRRAA